MIIKKKLLLCVTLVIFLIVILPNVYAGSFITGSQVEFLTTDQNSLLTGKVWSILWSAGGETDTIYGIIKADKITDGTYFGKQDLEISSSPIKNYVIWTIEPLGGSTYPQLRGLVHEFNVCWPWEVDGIVNSCKSNPKYVGHSVKVASTLIQNKILCVYFDDSLGIGTPGRIITPPQTHFTIDFNIKSGGSTSTITLDSGGSDVKSGSNYKSKDGRVYIRWLGNMYSSRLWIDPSPDDMAVYTTYGWGIRYKPYYDQYRNLINQVYTKISEWGSAPDSETADKTFSSYIDSVRSNYYLAMTKTVQDAFTGQGVTNVDKGLTTGKFRADLSHQFMYPQFRLYVVADWIGVYKPVGEPQIISAYVNDFKQPNGEIVVTVKNKGSYSGSFELRGVCNPPASYNDQTYMFTLGAGEQKTYKLKITGYTNKSSESASCTVYFKETTSGTEVSTKVYFNILGIMVCTPNTLSCSFDRKYVQKCSSDGMSLIVVKTCPTGTQCDVRNGVVDCYSTVVTPTPICGNGICETGEDYKNCPQDCPVPTIPPIQPAVPIIEYLVLLVGIGVFGFSIYREVKR